MAKEEMKSVDSGMKIEPIPKDIAEKARRGGDPIKDALRGKESARTQKTNK